MKPEKITKRKYFNVEVSIVLDKRYAKKDGTYNVSILVYHEKKYLYHQMKLTLHSWDEIHPDEEDKVYKEFDYVYKMVKNLYDDDVFSIESLKTILKAPKCNTVNDAMLQKIKKLEDNEQYATAAHYKSALKKFESYFGDDVSFNKVNAPMFNQFKENMSKEGNSISTIIIYMGDFKTVLSEAIALKMMPAKNFPFKQNKYDILKCELPVCPNKRTDCFFSKDEIDKLFDYFETCKPIAKKWLPLFFFSYLSGGINFADMLRLKYDKYYFDSGEKELQFIRRKTERHNKMVVRIPLFDYMKNLIKMVNSTHGRTTEPKEGDYVFPFINSNMTELEVKNTIFRINNKVSAQLKTFAKKCNIKKSPSTTYARHSFATNMRRMGVPAEYIEYAMGHAIKGVAGNYFGGYPFETMVKYNSMLLKSHELQLKAVS